jgi:hypothetical protein
MSKTGPTRLEEFIRANKIHRGHLAHASGYQIQRVRAVRLGLVVPDQRCKENIAQACSKLLGRAVSVDEVFEEEKIPNGERGKEVATKQARDHHPYVMFAVLTRAGTGRMVCVSGMHLATFEDTADGTLVKMANGETVTVEESFASVARAFGDPVGR